MAALLWIRRDCVLSHVSAAAVWGLAPSSETIYVTALGRYVRPRANVQIHRVAHLDPRDVRLRQRLPVTAPARTLIDLAGLERDATLERALAEARVARLVSDADLAAAIDRARGRPGVATVRRILEFERGHAPTRSEAERRFMALVDAAKLAAPASNVRVGELEVDFLWPAKKLVVEVDGHLFHSHRAAFERDHARDQALVASGHRVIRVTWRQLVDEPLSLVARIAQALCV